MKDVDLTPLNNDVLGRIYQTPVDGGEPENPTVPLQRLDQYVPARGEVGYVSQDLDVFIPVLLRRVGYTAGTTFDASGTVFLGSNNMKKAWRYPLHEDYFPSQHVVNSTVTYYKRMISDQPLHKNTPPSVRANPRYIPNYGMQFMVGSEVLFSAPVNSDDCTDCADWDDSWEVEFWSEPIIYDPLLGLVDFARITLVSNGGLKIYYSTDGGAPDTLYTEPLEFTATTAVKFEVRDANGYTSPYGVHEENITFSGATPPDASDTLYGEFWQEPYLFWERSDYYHKSMATWSLGDAAGTLKLTSESNYDIYYSTNGSFPTTLYAGPISITDTTEVRWFTKRPDSITDRYGRKRSYAVYSLTVTNDETKGLPAGFHINYPVIRHNGDDSGTSTPMGGTDEPFDGMAKMMAWSSTYPPASTTPETLLASKNGTRAYVVEDLDPVTDRYANVRYFRYGSPLGNNILLQPVYVAGRITFTWDGVDELSITSPDTTGEVVKYTLDPTAEGGNYTVCNLTYSGPLTITEDAVVTAITYKIGVTGGGYTTTTTQRINFTGATPPPAFVETYYIPVGPYENNNGRDEGAYDNCLLLAFDPMPLTPDYYITPTGTGDGLTPSTPSNWLTLLGTNVTAGSLTAAAGTKLIWASEGTYTNPSGDPSESFVVPGTCHLLGGFNSSFTKRDRTAYESIVEATTWANGSNTDTNYFILASKSGYPAIVDGFTVVPKWSLYNYEGGPNRQMSSPTSAGNSYNFRFCKIAIDKTMTALTTDLSHPNYSTNNLYGWFEYCDIDVAFTVPDITPPGGTNTSGGVAWCILQLGSTLIGCNVNATITVGSAASGNAPFTNGGVAYGVINIGTCLRGTAVDIEINVGNGGDGLNGGYSQCQVSASTVYDSKLKINANSGNGGQGYGYLYTDSNPDIEYASIGGASTCTITVGYTKNSTVAIDVASGNAGDAHTYFTENLGYSQSRCDVTLGYSNIEYSIEFSNFEVTATSGNAGYVGPTGGYGPSTALITSRGGMFCEQNLVTSAGAGGTLSLGGGVYFRTGTGNYFLAHYPEFHDDITIVEDPGQSVGGNPHRLDGTTMSEFDTSGTGPPGWYGGNGGDAGAGKIGGPGGDGVPIPGSETPGTGGVGGGGNGADGNQRGRYWELAP